MTEPRDEAPRDEQATADYWREKIRREERAHKKFRERAEKAEKAYYDEEEGKEQLFNLFHSTVDTLHSRLYSRVPKPDIRQRFDLQGPLAAAAKQGALVLERAISYTLDTSDFHEEADRVVHDFLVAGLGVPWVEYDAQIGERELMPGLRVPAVTLQRVNLVHVPWRRFHWEPGKTWRACGWVARDQYLTPAEIKRQWPDAELEAAGSAGASEMRDDADKGEERYGTTHRVTEIYYKPTRIVYVIGWDFTDPLEVRKDALGLEGFFPCPRPMFANPKSRDLVPTPDHHFNRSAYAYVNRLAQRIHNLTAQVKDVGFYDASFAELAGLKGASDGDLVGVRDLAAKLASGGTTALDFTKIVAKLPMVDKVTVLRELQALMAAEKARLDEVNGIADIIRGTSNPNETAAAQQIKSNFANLRMARRTGAVVRCLRDVFRLMAEIIGEHFNGEQLYLCTGLQVGPEVQQVLKSDMARALAVDIETDSTVAIEDEEDKRQRVEFLNYVTPFLERLLPAMQNGTLPADLGKQLLVFAVSTFKHGRQLLDAIEAAPDQAAQLKALQDQLQQCQQQLAQWQKYGQDAQQKLQQHDAAKQQADGMKAQAGVMAAQTGQFKAQADHAVAQGTLQLKAQEQQLEAASINAGRASVAML